MARIGRNTLADGAIGKWHVRGANGYKQNKIGDVKASVDGRLTLFRGVVEWVYTFTLDKGSVKEGDYLVMNDGDGKPAVAYDPSLDVTVRYYWWAHTVTKNGKQVKVSGKCPLPEHMGASWLPKEEIDRLNLILGKQKGDDACPLPVWIKVRESKGYNNPVSFGDETLKLAGKKAAEEAEEVISDYCDADCEEDAVDDEPVDDVPTIQHGEAEHDRPAPVDPQKEHGGKRRSRSS